MNETDYQRLFLLEAPRRLPNVRVFRRNVGVAAMGERKIRFGIKGQCDLYALARGGRFAEVEIKSLTGTLSKEQKAWRDFCLEWQVPWILLKPLRGELVEVTMARWCEELAACLGA